MTIRDFYDYRYEHTQEEYEEMFDEKARHIVYIDGVAFPALQLTPTKVAMRGGSIFQLGAGTALVKADSRKMKEVISNYLGIRKHDIGL